MFLFLMLTQHTRDSGVRSVSSGLQSMVQTPAKSPVQPKCYSSITTGRYSVNMEERVIALIDMDCFYCQVEVRLNPALKGKPVAVVQYNTWKGGGIIAVNYEARDMGVTRFMRGDDAQKHCPKLELAAVPEVRGRADLSKYRDASREVMAVLCDFCSCVEKASIDEAYLDLTDCISSVSERVEWESLKNTFVVGYSSDSEGTKQWLKDVFDGGINEPHPWNLARAALLVEEIRGVIQSKTGFHCSAGISYNKVLAKLACGLHKPNRQTVLPQTSVPILFQDLPLKKIRNLGGKFGVEVNEQLDVKTIGEVTKFSLNELQRKFGEKHGSWLYNIARGIDTEPVKARIVAKSIGCCKNFKGYLALATKNDVKHWLAELCAEIYERLQDDLITNQRKATLLTVSAQREADNSYSFSRSSLLNSYNVDDMIKNCYLLLCKFNQASSESPAWEPPLKFLGVSASKFLPVADPSHSLLNFFKRKAVDEPDCSASTSTMDQLSGPQMPAETEKSSDNVARARPENVAEAETPPPFLDSGDSFFCSYFGNAVLNITNESTENGPETDTTEELVPDESTELDSCVPMERCPECGNLVAIMDIPEHADYHAARKLHNELNGMPAESSNAATVAAGARTTRSWTHSSVTRGKNKKLVRPKSDSVVAKNQSITSFFQTKHPR